MELTFYLFIIASILGVFVIAKKKIEMKDEKGNVQKTYSTRGLGIFILVFSAFMLFLSSFSIVSTNKIGFVTQLGRPVDAYDNGWVWKAPWQNMPEQFDAARQFMRFDGQGNNEDDIDKKVFPCIEVKLDGQAKACVKGVISWQMKAETVEQKSNALALFKTYRSFDRLTRDFVYSSSRKALGEVFSHHNPLVETKNQSLGELNTMAMKQLVAEFNNELTITSVDLAVPDYDEKTDESISALQAQKAKTLLATEEQATNEAKNTANKKLLESLKDPSVNVANCIQAAIQLNKEPGYCLMGGGSVIVGTGRGAQP